MDDIYDRIEELTNEGFNCSQIMLMLSLEMRGIENPLLVRSLAGLGNGLHCQNVCGTLTGGCCLIASYGAKASKFDAAAIPYKAMVQNYTDWFGKEFGSVICKDLIGGDKMKMMNFCPELIETNFMKCMDLLRENGVDTGE